MLRSRDPNRMPAPAVSIPVLGSNRKTATEAKTQSVMGADLFASPAATHKHVTAWSTSMAAAAAVQPKAMMTFKRVGINSSTGAPSPGAHGGGGNTPSAPPSQPVGLAELHVIECDPEEEPEPGYGAQPSLSLRRATAATTARTTAAAAGGALPAPSEGRSPSPEPMAPSCTREEWQDEGDGANGEAGGPLCGDDDSNDRDSVSAIPSTRRARSLEKDFIPDHLLNNEDFIDRLVSEVQHSCRLAAESDEDSDGDGANNHYDAEVLACLHRGNRKALQRRTRRRSLSPARSRSPCMDAVALSAPATGNSWSAERHQTSAYRQLQRHPLFPQPGGPTGATGRVASTAAGGQQSIRAAANTAPDFALESAVELPLRAPSSVAAVTASRESSPTPRQPSPAVHGQPPASALLGRPGRGRRAAGVSRDRGTSPGLSPSPRQQQQQQQRVRPASPAVSSASRSHPTWEPRPVQQHRPAWGQRVPPNPAKAASSHGTSPSPKAPSMPQPHLKGERSTAVSRDGSRHASAAHSAEESVKSPTDAAQVASATASPALAGDADSGARCDGGSSSHASSQPPFARVLFGDPGFSPLSLEEGNGKDAACGVSAPLSLHELREATHAALARAARAEARCAELERQLHQRKCEQALEREDLEARLVQLSQQLTFAVDWIQSFDPSSVKAEGSVGNETTGADAPGSREAAESPEAMGSHMSGSDDAAAHRKDCEFQTDPRLCLGGTPYIQGATPTPTGRDSSNSGRNAATTSTADVAATSPSAKGQSPHPGGSVVRLPPSPPMVLHLLSQ